MTTSKQNEFFAAGKASVQHRVKLSALFLSIKAMDNTAALVAVSDILKGAASVQQATIDKATKGIAAAKHAIDVQSNSKKPDVKKIEAATAELVDAQAAYAQAVADQKADVSAVWNACRQYTRLDTRDNQTIQYKGGSVQWLKTQGKSEAEKTAANATRAAEKTAAEQKQKELEERAATAGDIQSVNWSNVDFARLVSMLNAEQRRELSAELIKANQAAEKKAAKRSKAAPLAAVA